MARPTELNREVIRKIAEAIYPAGNYFEVACVLAGISKATGYTWLAMAKGEKRRRPGVPSDLLLELLNAVEKAEADLENATVVYWRNQTVTDWRSAESFLAKRFQKRWKSVERTEITGDEGKPIQVEDVTLSDADRVERIAAILDAARARKAGQALGDAAGEVQES